LTQGTDGAVVPASDEGTAGAPLALGAAGAAAAPDPAELPDDEPDGAAAFVLGVDEPDDPDTVSEMYFWTAEGSTCTASPSSPVS
jgi:hypothetical protein